MVEVASASGDCLPCLFVLENDGSMEEVRVRGGLGEGGAQAAASLAPAASLARQR